MFSHKIEFLDAMHKWKKLHCDVFQNMYLMIPPFLVFSTKKKIIISFRINIYVLI